MCDGMDTKPKAIIHVPFYQKMALKRVCGEPIVLCYYDLTPKTWSTVTIHLKISIVTPLLTTTGVSCMRDL